MEEFVFHLNKKVFCASWRVFVLQSSFYFQNTTKKTDNFKSVSL